MARLPAAVFLLLICGLSLAIDPLHAVFMWTSPLKNKNSKYSELRLLSVEVLITRNLVRFLLSMICWTTFAWSQEVPAAPTELSPDSVQALLINKVSPVYPPLARQAGIQGTVVLRIVINKAGEVRDVRLFSGHPMLAPAAIEAVKQWKYQPYMQDGEAIEVATQVQVNFRLANEPAPKDTAGSGPGAAADQGFFGVVSASPGGRVPANVYRVSEAEMRTLRSEKVDPAYPPLALQARIQGMVVLEVLVTETGEVRKVSLVSGHPMLVQATIDAVKHWKYKPYVKDGTPIVVVSMVRLTFALSENGMVGEVSEPPALAAPPAPRAGVPLRVRVSSGVSQGLLLSRITPEYPADARDQHIQGVVILHLNIDKEGTVYNVELISGHELLAPAAIAAVRQWKYRPYLLNGEPVEVDTQVRVNFVLAE